MWGSYCLPRRFWYFILELFRQWGNVCFSLFWYVQTFIIQKADVNSITLHKIWRRRLEIKNNRVWKFKKLSSQELIRLEKNTRTTDENQCLMLTREQNSIAQTVVLWSSSVRTRNGIRVITIVLVNRSSGNFKTKWH